MSHWIATIEEHLAVSLPAALREMYEQRDGEGAEGSTSPPDRGRALRFMGSREVIETFDNYSSCGNLRSSAPFWAGSNGEYAFMFLSGPLLNRIYMFDYDGRNESVSFRGPGSLVESLDELANSGEGDGNDLRTDYYVPTEYFIRGNAQCKPASDAEVASDLAAQAELRAEYLRAEIQDERDYHHYALNIMALTPERENDAIFEFLESSDMWIQERACALLGQRRYEPAIPRLGAVARTGTTNGRGAALDALGRIGTPGALAEVLSCLAHFSKDGWRVSTALQRCGCEIKKENVDPRGIQSPDYLYRLPASSEWKKL